MKLHSQRLVFPAFRLRVLAAAAFAICSGHALAVQPFTVKDIRVEGLQRTEAGTVFSYLPLRVGDTYTDEKGIAAIKALYSTGFFKDVRIEVEGNVLVIGIEERPSIASVTYTGFKEFEKDQLDKALKEIGLSVARTYDKSLVERAEQELKRQYLSRGRYDAQITTTITPIERNRVEINFVADEGDVSKIRKIALVGNKAFSDRQLHKALKLRTPGWFTWYDKSDQYSKQKLTGDIETLKSFYMDRGYIEMQIESTQVAISPDKKSVFITLNISEGEKYKVSGIKLEGEMFGRKPELESLMQLKAGDVYSAEKMADSTKKISERLGNFGYAFANVNANPEIDRKNKQVAFTVLIDPGKRVYVRRINIGGNTRTRDEVIRREFRQFEDSWYDGEKIKRSKERVDKLDYFKEVSIETPEVPDANDQVDVNLTVTEKSTGMLSVGAGFSQAEGIILSGSVQEINAFGSGNTIGLDLNTSKVNRTLSLSQFTPYLTDDGLSRGIQIFTRTSRPPLLNSDSYKIQTNGANVQFGTPLSEFDSVFVGIGLESTKVATFLGPLIGNDGYPLLDTNGNVFLVNSSPTLYQRYVHQFAGPNALSATTLSVPLTFSWLQDTRDSGLTPTMGHYQRAGLELTPGRDLRYYRLTYQAQYFKPIVHSLVAALNGEMDYARGYGNKPFPVFKNYYAGGIGTVRGFEGSSLGPVDPLTAEPLGGAARLFGNAELQLSPTGSGKDNAFKVFAFVDAGNVFAEKEKIQFSQLRYSTGIGVSWVSPVGPMRISWAKPLNAKPGDRIEHFQFQVGTGF